MKKISNEIKRVILITLLSKVFIWLCGYIGWQFFHSIIFTSNCINNSFLQIWTTWDASWYLLIAKSGYVYSLTFAFFPLYPFLIRLLSYLTNNFELSGFLISNFMSFIAAIYLFKIVKLEYGSKIAYKSILYFSLFPGSLFLSALYAESLFATLLIVSFYYARKGEWWKSGIAGFFSSMTRPIGFLIFIPLIYEYFKQYKITKLNKVFNIKKNILFLLLIPLGFALVLGYFYTLSHDSFIYINAVGNPEWNIRLESPWTTLLNSIKYINDSDSFILYEMNILTFGFNYIFLIFFIFLTILGKKYLRNIYMIFIIINILVILFVFSALEDSIRFSIPVFPFFML